MKCTILIYTLDIFLQFYFSKTFSYFFTELPEYVMEKIFLSVFRPL